MPNGAELYRLMKQAQLWEQRLLRTIDEGGSYINGAILPVDGRWTTR